jgi:hypothetical protein
MIVTHDSPITLIPKELPGKYVLLLEGIRYSANMALVSYGRLRAHLHDISTTKAPGPEYWYLALSYTWSVIDSANRFIRLVKKFDIKGALPHEADFEKISKIRNTFHHIDERIEEKYLSNHIPLFGLLCWAYYEPEKSETITTYIFAPGILQGEVSFPSPNPVGKAFRVPIDLISIRAHEKAKANREPIEVELPTVITAIEETTRLIEKNMIRIYSQLKNPNDTFLGDALVNFFIE